MERAHPCLKWLQHLKRLLERWFSYPLLKSSHSIHSFSQISSFIMKITAENPNQILSKKGRWCNSCLCCHRQSPERTWLEVSHWTILFHRIICSITTFCFFPKILWWYCFDIDTTLHLWLCYLKVHYDISKTDNSQLIVTMHYLKNEVAVRLNFRTISLFWHIFTWLIIGMSLKSHSSYFLSDDLFSRPKYGIEDMCIHQWNWAKNNPMGYQTKNTWMICLWAGSRS